MNGRVSTVSDLFKGSDSTRPVNENLPSRHLAARARRAFGGRTPTTLIGVRGQEGGPDEQHVRFVIDLVLRAGELMLSTGASAADVTAAVIRLAKCYGVRSLHVDVTYSSLTISHHRGVHRDPITVMRIAAVMQLDFTRLERLQKLIRDAEKGDLPLSEARERLDAIVHAPHLYSRQLVIGSGAVMGASIALLLGASWVVVLVSAITTTLVQIVVRDLDKRGVPAFFVQAAGAAVPTLAAVALLVLKNNLEIELFADIRPSVVVASGVVVLLAGLTVVGAAQDTIDGFFITASASSFKVLVLSGGIVAGVLAVLEASRQLGVAMVVTPTLTFSTDRVVGLIAISLTMAAFGVATYAGPRTIGFTVLVGIGAWLVLSETQEAGFSAQWATVAAAVVVGACATSLGSRLKIPSLAVASAAIVPMLPGLMVYRGVFELVNLRDDPAQGGSTMFAALMVGMAIASGLTLGSLPGRLLRPYHLKPRQLKRRASSQR